MGRVQITAGSPPPQSRDRSGRRAWGRTGVCEPKGVGGMSAPQAAGTAMPHPPSSPPAPSPPPSPLPSLPFYLGSPCQHCGYFSCRAGSQSQSSHTELRSCLPAPAGTSRKGSPPKSEETSGQGRQVKVRRENDGGQCAPLKMDSLGSSRKILRGELGPWGLLTGSLSWRHTSVQS